MSDPFASIIDERPPETIAELAALCAAVAERFRWGRDAEAHAALPAALLGIEQALRAGILDVEASAPILTELSAAMERQDLLLVADILELVIARSLTG